MQRRKLLWFAGVGVAAALIQGWVSARPARTRGGEGEAPMTPRSARRHPNRALAHGRPVCRWITGRSTSRCGRCRRGRARRRGRSPRCSDACSRTSTCCSSLRDLHAAQRRPTSSCRSSWDWVKGRRQSPGRSALRRHLELFQSGASAGCGRRRSRALRVRQLRCHRRDPEPAHVEEADRTRCCSRCSRSARAAEGSKPSIGAHRSWCCSRRHSGSPLLQ